MADKDIAEELKESNEDLAEELDETMDDQPSANERLKKGVGEDLVDTILGNDAS